MLLQSTIRSVYRGAIFTAGVALVLASTLSAQVSSYGEKQMGPVNQKPSVTSKISITQRLNQPLPLSAVFTDETGKQVQLASYFGQKPAILALVYYQCPMLCSEELNGLTGALQMVDEKPGRDFNIIVVSIDPTEGTNLAAAKKRSYLKRYGYPETADGWHFLTGTQSNIDALTQAVGFGYTKIPGPDGKLTQYAHASAIQIITDQGRIAQYYMGVEYSPKDLRLGLVEASNNRIGSPVDNILTYCYHYDPGTNKHSLIVARIVQLGGLVTVFTLGGFMFVMFRHDAQSAKTDKDKGPDSKVNG
ncbi:MAG TPA: SCO family protein [Terracidiphilus sp.]|jgi:protein SCO1